MNEWTFNSRSSSIVERKDNMLTKWQFIQRKMKCHYFLCSKFHSKLVVKVWWEDYLTFNLNLSRRDNRLSSRLNPTYATGHLFFKNCLQEKAYFWDAEISYPLFCTLQIYLKFLLSVFSWKKKFEFETSTAEHLNKKTNKQKTP